MNSPKKSKQPRDPHDRYMFFVSMRNEHGEYDEIVWRGLTYKQARDMYAYTDDHQPSNVTNYGWEIIRPSLTPEPVPNTTA